MIPISSGGARTAGALVVLIENEAPESSSTPMLLNAGAQGSSAGARADGAPVVVAALGTSSCENENGSGTLGMKRI